MPKNKGGGGGKGGGKGGKGAEGGGDEGKSAKGGNAVKVYTVQLGTKLFQIPCLDLINRIIF